MKALAALMIVAGMPAALAADASDARTELDRLSARADLLPHPEPSETHDPASRGN